VPRISYFPYEKLEDPELRGYIDAAHRYGTPRPESQSIRAHVPAVLRSFSTNWERVFRNGVCDHRIKELCRVYVSKTIACDYWGTQRSLRGGEQGLVEEDYDELLEFERSDRFDERQKAALLYTSMLVWNPEGADDRVWKDLRKHFTDEEIVELGYFVALTYGQQRWIKTLAIGHGEVVSESRAGLASEEAEV
jgi:alkylhydroperoxidase family enzyme